MPEDFKEAETILKKAFFLPCIVYLLGIAIIFPFVRLYADNPDTFQYTTIAAKYLSGDWQHAVNGYWSPLISWLLALPMLLLNDELLAFKFLQIVIGGFTLYQWIKLLDKTGITKKLQTIVVYFSIPFLLVYSLLNATPDLLFVGLLSFLANRFIVGNIFGDRKTALQIGIAGGLLYLTKAFGLPFFIAVTVILLLMEIRNSGTKQINKKNVAILYGTFLTICLCWIVTISLHYNHFTISEAARFNMSRDVAPLPGRSDDLPVLGVGLYTPQTNSMCAWETPGDYVNPELITLFNSPNEYFQVVKRNLLSIYYFDFRHQAGTIFFLLMIIFVFVKGIKKIAEERWLIIFLVFILLIYCGYSLILFHTRYTWINNFLMMALSVYFIQQIFISPLLKRVSVYFIAIVLLFNVKRPLKELFFTEDKAVSFHLIFQTVSHPFDMLWVFYRPDAQLKRVTEEVKIMKMISGNLASLKSKGYERDGYTSAMRIGKENNCKYFGQLNNELSIETQLIELMKMNIDFLITWNFTEWGNEKPIYFNPDAGVRVYSLK